ncbi:uncharacterized protein RHOBADRAFT_41234 [Rhodotorula graminis WP1]|uniref:Rab proteins geranylgeranyltransferase n=1 Tax=Rhodotorula graminis (strain WP1) TaxID=578459 RepID=A0A194SGA3_RHOGW|nr:uncharacterized protein RHOBADRAFT_41234 [Rhodotorula graminis WP1]KPV78691.1 hypothetical protein RHOBADRAFT_41234 [Rhodotorula graminis WP1]
MDANEPTHFNVLIAGTGLHESILAAALSKAGYSVLQLDSAPYYGTEHASLSLLELADWAAANSDADPSSSSPPDSLRRISQRFALSLYPVLLRAKGPAIDLLVRSKVASYLQFGLLGGIALWQSDGGGGGEGTGKGKAVRVPASKADVFNDPTLSLVEKRRLTKLLLFAAGDDSLEHDKVLAADPDTSFVDYLKKGFSLSGTVASSLAYALALCSSPTDAALPALQRLRAMIQSMGRYGPSPYLVGHYGGAGDLVGGFSRICAVWGGGQILGRPILPLDPSPTVGLPVPASQPPFAVHDKPPPPPAASTSDAPSDETRPLGIPVQLEEGQEPTMFTGDWVVTSPHLLSTLVPAHSSSMADPAPSSVPRTAHLIALLPSPISFPPPRRPEGATDDDADLDEPDSKLLVFPPGAFDERLGTCSALMVGSGTMSCPEGYYVLYLAAPVLSTTDSPAPTARALLSPYLDAPLLSPTPLDASSAEPSPPTPIEPLYSVAYLSPTPPDSPPSTASPSASTTSPSSSSLPANLLVTSSPTPASTAAALVDTLDALPPAVESAFWTIVGSRGRDEGVEFFARAPEGGTGAGGEGDEED